MRNKHELPPFGEIKHIPIDHDRLMECLMGYPAEYTDVISANPALCMNHKALVDSVYDSFGQINLTTVDPSKLMEPTTDVKERIRRREERLYNIPTTEYQGSYFEQLVNQFFNQAMRVRITRLDVGKDIPFHIDYDPTYATRIIIPIITNPDVANLFKVKGKLISCHLDEGKAYFLNTGFPHSVVNSGSTARIALMFSLEGQDDLRYL